MTSEKKKFNWGALIIGILLLITGFFAFCNPAGSLISLAFIFGIVGIVRGIFQIYSYTKLNKIGIKNGWLIFVGIINILLGIFIFINWQASVIALPWAFAIWFLADSIVDLFTLPAVKKINNSLFWLKLIVDILAIIAGIFLWFDPITSALTLAFLVGFYFTIKGIEFIVSSFS